MEIGGQYHYNQQKMSLIQYGTIKDHISIYMINDKHISLKEKAGLFFRDLLNE